MIILLFTIIGFIVMPMIVIWALNTLFRLKVAYNVKTWLAMVILLVVVLGKWPLPFDHNHWPFPSYHHQNHDVSTTYYYSNNQ